MLPSSRASADGEYVLIERLGKGGVAETWRAQRRGGATAGEVCVKRPIRPLDAQGRRDLYEEARLLARIRHDNVVALLDVLAHPEEPWLVLELVQGVDLRVLGASLREHKRRLPPPVVASIGVDLCRALGAANRAVPGGVVHRDVTPHNVLVSRDGQVKLADFGVARAFDRAGWTRPGLIKGKRAYVSPEQLAGQRLDVRSDLFAVGVVLFELASGRRPFGGANGTGALRAIACGERASLGLPEADRRFVQAVDLLLARERTERPSDADCAAQMLASTADPEHARRLLGACVLAARRPRLVKTLNRCDVVFDPTLSDITRAITSRRARASADRHGR